MPCLLLLFFLEETKKMEPLQNVELHAKLCLATIQSTSETGKVPEDTFIMSVLDLPTGELDSRLRPLQSQGFAS